MSLFRTVLLWLFIIVVAALGMYGGYWLVGGPSSGVSQSAVPSAAASEEKASLIDAIDAAVLCQEAVKQSSLNADKAEFPYSKPLDNGESWRILWIQSKKAKLQNQFGAMIDTNVICNVNKKEQIVDQLIIDSQKVIGN